MTLTATLRPDAPIVLHGFKLSGHSHRAELFLELLGLPYEFRQVDLAGGACFIALGLAAALGGERAFLAWLLLSPAVPWLVHRRLARRGLLSPAAPPAP